MGQRLANNHTFGKNINIFNVWHELKGNWTQDISQESTTALCETELKDSGASG